MKVEYTSYVRTKEYIGDMEKGSVWSGRIIPGGDKATFMVTKDTFSSPRGFICLESGNFFEQDMLYDAVFCPNARAII